MGNGTAAHLMKTGQAKDTYENGTREGICNICSRPHPVPWGSRSPSLSTCNMRDLSLFVSRGRWQSYESRNECSRCERQERCRSDRGRNRPGTKRKLKSNVCGVFFSREGTDFLLLMNRRALSSLPHGFLRYKNIYQDLSIDVPVRRRKKVFSDS